MRVKNRRADRQSQPVSIESLESRTYFDLVPSITGVLPSTAIAGTKTTDAISVKLTNSGDATIHGAYTLTLFVSPDGLTSDGTQFFLKDENLVPLAAGKSRTIRVPVGEFPVVTNGAFFVVAEVGGSLAGVGDNSGHSTGEITLTDAFIDLTDSITLSNPVKVKPGQFSAVKVTVNNEGNVAAKGPLAFLLGTSLNSDGSSSTEIAEPSRNINLAANHHMSFVFSHKVPVGFTPDNYFGTVDIDPNNTFDETNVSNNTAVTATSLDVEDPFKNLIGTLDGTFHTTHGPGHGAHGTVAFVVSSESDTTGAISGTGSNSLPASFTIDGTVTATGAVTIDGDDTVDDITSVFKGHIVGSKLIGTFLNSNGSGGTITVTI